MWSNLFRQKADRPALDRVKASAQALLGEGVALSVNEIICTDPGCPGTETVILVMRPGARTIAAKIARPAAEVTEAEIAEALRVALNSRME